MGKSLTDKFNLHDFLGDKFSNPIHDNTRVGCFLADIGLAGGYVGAELAHLKQIKVAALITEHNEAFNNYMDSIPLSYTIAGITAAYFVVFILPPLIGWLKD